MELGAQDRGYSWITFILRIMSSLGTELKINVHVEDVQYGEIYAVVLDGLRTVKVIRKSITKGM